MSEKLKKNQLNEKEIYMDSVNFWEGESIYVMLIEEMSELTKALTKLLRNKLTGRRPEKVVEYKKNIKEELVDVEIMLNILKEFFDEKELFKMKEKKLKRLNKRMETGDL